MAFSFGTSGAVPQIANPLSAGSLSLSPSAPPAAKALATASQPFKTPASTIGGGLGAIPSPSSLPQTSMQQRMQGTFNTTPAAPQPGMLSTPTAQPTSHTVTVNNVDGSSHTTKQTYPDTANVEKATPQTTVDSTSTPPTVNPNSSFQTNTGNAPQGTPAPQTNPTDFQGLLGGAATAAGGNAAIGQKAQDIAASYKPAFDALAPQMRVGGLLTTGTTPVAQGRAAAALATGESQANVLTQGENAALAGINPSLTAQGQEASGLNNAAGLIPEALRYGGSGGSGGSTSGLDPQTQATQLADLVANGKMDYNTAVSQMSQYGAAGTPSLRNAILAKNPNFNFNLSQSSAQTQAIGQQIQAAIPPANQALDALQTAFNGLSSLQQGSVPFIGNVPLVSQFAQNSSMALGPGRDAASAFQGALNEARARIDGALQGVIGVDAAAKQATALLPDNMTPTEIPQKIAAAKQYLQNQVQSYTESGNQQQSSGIGTNTQGGSIWSF